MNPRILVATDGTTAASGALRLANAMAEKFSANVEVMGVVAPVPVFDAGFLVAVPEVELYQSRQEALRLEIHKQVEEFRGAGNRWPVRVESGVPGPRIVKRAEVLEVDYIFMGLGEHKALDRIFGTETALQVIRLSHVPVLAVPETAQDLPSAAALGVDFSHFSRRALSSVAALLARPWEIHLVHVMAGMEFLPTMSESWRSGYEDELEGRLQAVADELGVPDGCSVHLHILEGDPSHQLLAFTEERGIPLLVAGSHGHSFMGRLLIGSVSTRLVRGARIPILVVPPEDRTPEVFPDLSNAKAEHPWVAELKDFSRANAGRKTTLELSDEDTGTRECGKGLPLWGVCYDPRRDRVEIMLGRTGTVEGHLTHSISGPREILVERDREGRALALRIRLRAEEVHLKIHRE